MIFGFGGKKVVGIGLDGFPHSLAARFMDEGRMPNLRRLAEEGTFRTINSVYPTVSGVAWSAFQTGANPGEFGVFGFVELERDFSLYIPNARNLQAGTIWERLSREKKRVVSLSVPMTYPAPSVKGLLVSGFLAPALDERAVSSPDVLPKLRSTGYEIDIDPTAAARSLEQFQQDLQRVSQARQRTALRLLQDEKWNLFFVHMMDTDRINHFMWRYLEAPESPEGRFFLDFYQQIDRFIGEVVKNKGSRTDLLILSDHGFCGLKYEVQLNRWLRRQGYLDYEDNPEKMYRAVRPGSRALALVPGRIHLLTEDRWDGGGVPPGGYEPLREELTERLRELRHPDTRDRVCNRVMNKEEVFSGPCADSAPDIVIDPCRGYDLKAKLGQGDLFERGHRSGMHTHDDAMLVATDGLEEVSRAEDVRQAGALLRDHFL